MAHFRRLKNDSEMRKCASRLTASEYLQLQDLVDKIREKTPCQKVDVVEPALPAKRLKKEISDVSVDSEGYPKIWRHQRKRPCQKVRKAAAAPWQKVMCSATPPWQKEWSTKGKALEKRMGSRVLPMSSSLDAGLEHAFGFKEKRKGKKTKALAKGKAKALAKGKAKALAKGKAKALAQGKAKALAQGKAKALAKGGSSSGSKPPWWRLRITRSLKPPRAYITGSKEVGAKKLPLIVEVSGKRSKKYNQVIDMIYRELQDKHLTKEEAIQLRDELC